MLIYVFSRREKTTFTTEIVWRLIICSYGYSCIIQISVDLIEYLIPASFSNGTGSDRGCLLSDLETGGCCGLSGGLFRGCSKKCAPFHYLRVQSITENFTHIVNRKRIFSKIGVSIRLLFMNRSSIITPQSQLALFGRYV